ncbi:DMT family transporter [Dyella lipolytica]|uniref:DMT family transporter n=1 Tax=Dyella lipolytica TaxID=1867835 RepID=A0ABW8IXB0_9GAMM|nr:DMT family transporter [Dyella lipolytica]
MTPSSQPNDRRGAVLQLVFAECLISSVGVFVHESHQDAFTAVFYRCLFGGLFLLGWGLAKGYLRGLWHERVLLRGAVLSGVLLVLNWVALFAGMARSSIGVATLVYQCFPFVMLILATLVQGERTQPADLAWTVLGFVGVICTSDPVRLFRHTEQNYLIGVGLAFLAALFCGVSLLMSRQIGKERPFALVMIQCWVGVAMLAGFSSSSVFHIGLHWAWLLGLGVIHSGIVYVLFYSTYPRLPVVTIAVVSFIYPLMALLLDYLLYGHRLVLVQMAGVALIVLGTLGVNLKWRPGFAWRTT